LFELQIDDILIWERIRERVWREIRKENTKMEEAHTQIESSRMDYIKGGMLFAKNLVSRNPFFSHSADILFVGHSRRKKEGDGKWWDIYCDPIHEYCDYDYVHFEFDHLLTHYTPAKTENIRYLDIIKYGKTIQRLLGIKKPTISETTEERLKTIEVEINRRFDSKIDFTELVQRQLYRRRTQLSLYQYLFSRIDPDVVVIVVSYGKMVIIEACKKLDIPVVELQHGVIDENDFAYSFRGSRDKKVFPDYLFVWGDFWKEAADFPIPDERVVPVGNPYLERSLEKYKNIMAQEQILFISQGTIGKQLSQFAVEVHEHPDITCDIVYKLHPGEYDRWENQYPWLIDTDFEVVDDPERGLYPLFAESTVQIGVYSTAIYEGLAFELDTYLYDCDGVRQLQPLINNNIVDLVSSVDEFLAALQEPSRNFDKNQFFEPDAADRICKVLKERFIL
jgi:hypothetical protein